MTVAAKAQAMTDYGKPLEWQERDLPDPEGAEVLLKVSHCGVCHSDVHLHDGFFELGGDAKLPLKFPLPHVLGHEIEGEVVAKGPEAEGVEVGDHVVAYPWIGCGKCAICERGEEHLCNDNKQLGIRIAGGFADHVLVPHARYCLSSDGIAPGLAATYMCSGITAFSAVKKLGEMGPRDDVLVIGLGGVGMMGLQFAKALFPKAPLAADIDPNKLQAAQGTGAGDVFDASDPDAVKKIQKATGGGVAGAIDFVGSEKSLALANGALRKGGTAVVVGLFGGGFSMPIPMWPLRAISLVGSFVGSLEETKEMLELVREGKVDPIPVEERPLAKASDTLDDLRQGRIMGRVVLKP